MSWERPGQKQILSARMNMLKVEMVKVAIVLTQIEERKIHTQVQVEEAISTEKKLN